jgi:hypothetical protein
MPDDRCGKFIGLTASLKLAGPGGQYIPDPPAISPVGERDQESAGLPKNIYRRVVEPAGFSTYVCDDTEARQSGCESDRKSICKSSMEGCYATFAEPD